jgi:hypothetical protein
MVLSDPAVWLIVRAARHIGAARTGNATVICQYRTSLGVGGPRLVENDAGPSITALVTSSSRAPAGTHE